MSAIAATFVLMVAWHKVRTGRAVGSPVPWSQIRWVALALVIGWWVLVLPEVLEILSMGPL